MLSWLWRWRRGALSGTRVVMYTRKGCHLCDDAWVLLEAARRRWGFGLEAVDIDTDAALVAEHGLSVPVVAVDRKVRFRGIVNRHLLERLLRAEAGKRGS